MNKKQIAVISGTAVVALGLGTGAGILAATGGIPYSEHDRILTELQDAHERQVTSLEGQVSNLLATKVEQQTTIADLQAQVDSAPSHVSGSSGTLRHEDGFLWALDAANLFRFDSDADRIYLGDLACSLQDGTTSGRVMVIMSLQDQGLSTEKSFAFYAAAMTYLCP